MHPFCSVTGNNCPRENRPGEQMPYECHGSSFVNGIKWYKTQP